MRRKSVALSASRRPLFDLRMRGASLRLGRETKIMGVLNVTPDSFSDGGWYEDSGLAEARALQMEREGAHILDLGGESTRPGSKPVTVKEEIRRILPVLKRLARRLKIPISVDTYKYEVASAALDEGASAINDIYGLSGDKRLGRRIARNKAAVILMHMKGNPLTMQKKASTKDPLSEIASFLRAAARRALDAGIPRNAVVLDPGFGFGKTPDQNLRILGCFDTFSRLKFPLLAGLSRKSFIGHLLDAPVDQRVYGSLGAAAVAVQNGAHILRVHDVLPHVQMARLIDRAAAEREV